MGKPPKVKTPQRSLEHQIRGLKLKEPRKDRNAAPVVTQADYDEDIVLNVDYTTIARAQTLKPSKYKAVEFFTTADVGELEVFADVNVLDEEIAVQNALASFNANYTPYQALDSLRPIFVQLAPIFRSYRTGSLPKVMRQLPLSAIWLPLLEATEPMQWTPASLKELTKLFISQLNDQYSFIYINNVLFPRARADLQRRSKLSVQVFEALVKSTYRPNAFLKATLEMVKMNDGAVFTRAVCAVMRRCSFPRNSVISILQVYCQAEANGANLAFIATVLGKSYALAEINLDSILQFILRNLGRVRILVFYDLILYFAQRYGGALYPQQLVQLYEACKANKQGGGIDDEILRVLRKQSQSSQSTLGRFGFAQDDIVI